MTATAYALDATAKAQGLLHQHDMLADDALLLDRSFTNGAIQFSQAEHPTRGHIVLQMPAPALPECVEAAGGVAVVRIDDEIPHVLAEHRQEKIQVQ
jgi:hypothetical protein